MRPFGPFVRRDGEHTVLPAGRQSRKLHETPQAKGRKVQAALVRWRAGDGHHATWRVPRLLAHVSVISVGCGCWRPDLWWCRCVWGLHSMWLPVPEYDYGAESPVRGLWRAGGVARAPFRVFPLSEASYEDQVGIGGRCIADSGPVR